MQPNFAKPGTSEFDSDKRSKSTNAAKTKTKEPDMRFLAFDPSNCRFEQASKQAALHAADVQVISDHQPPKR